MLKGLYYFVVALLVLVIVSGLIWIVQPGEIERLDVIEEVEFVVKDDNQNSDQLADSKDIIINEQTSVDGKLAVANEKKATKKNDVAPVSDESYSTWLEANQMLSQGSEAGSKKAYDKQQAIVEERNQTLDELYHLRDGEDETSWKIDPELERLALLHLTQGLSNSDLNTMFDRRYEKDLTNLIVILPLFDYFFPANQFKDASAELMVQKGIHLGSSKLKLLKYEFTDSQLFNLKLDKMHHFDSKTVIADLNAVEFKYPAWQLMFEKSYFEKNPYSIHPEILSLLSSANINSSNTRVRAFSLMVEKFLLSEEALLSWILDGRDQLELCKKCAWLLYTAFDEELSQAVWMQLFRYFLPGQHEYVVSVISQLEDNDNVDALSMWQSLIISFPALSSIDPFSGVDDFPTDVIELSDRGYIIAVLWVEYFQNGELLSLVMKNDFARRNYSEARVKEVLKTLTWSEILNQTNVEFTDKDLGNHEKYVERLHKDMEGLGLETSFSKLEASFLYDLISYQLQKNRMISKGSLDIESLKKQYSKLKQKLPIAARLGFLNEELFVYVLSGDKDVVGSQQIFGFQNFQRYYFSYKLKQILNTYEIFYYYRNNKMDFKSEKHSDYLNEITHLMIVGCVAWQFQNGDESLGGVKKCLKDSYGFLISASGMAHWVDNERQNLQEMFGVLQGVGMSKLAELWKGGVFDISWLELK